MPEYRICVPCLFGLESVVADELKALGFEQVTSENGRVNCLSDAAGIPRANINLRCGERVLVEVGSFHAPTFDALFEGAKALPWENYIAADGEFPVKGSQRDSKIFSIPDAQGIIKKAIVERLKQTYKTDWFEETGPRYRIQFMLVKDTATLYIDTSGAGLHKRGYRANSVEAPLRETLAAAIVKLSRWRGDRPLMDPFCGSGTIPIEAAYIAGDIAPGLFRRFEAENWPILPKAIWETERKRAKDAVRAADRILYASDISAPSVALAEENARKAGVHRLIRFSVSDALAVDFSPIERDGGYLFANPPYGERISDTTEVDALYRALAEKFEQTPALKRFILSNHAEFERIFGRADKRRKLYNGMLICNLYSYFSAHRKA